jgi:hypothetical protein
MSDESESTTEEDELDIFFCAEMNPAAVRPRINKTAIAPLARHMRTPACCSDVRGLLTVI